VRKVVLETTSSNEDDEFAVVGTSPEQARSKAKTMTGLFAREHVSEGEEEEDEGLLSPDSGDEPVAGSSVHGDGPQSESQTGGASNASGKKKSRRKKRKGGKS
jgi:metal transporter CNNM